jgi:hypothetical protein
MQSCCALRAKEVSDSFSIMSDGIKAGLLAMATSGNFYGAPQFISMAKLKL